MPDDILFVAESGISERQQSHRIGSGKRRCDPNQRNDDDFSDKKGMLDPFAGNRLMVKIKICGLKQVEDAEMLNELRPDFARAVFAPSKRQISLEQRRWKSGPP